MAAAVVFVPPVARTSRALAMTWAWVQFMDLFAGGWWGCGDDMAAGGHASCMASSGHLFDRWTMHVLLLWVGGRAVART